MSIWQHKEIRKAFEIDSARPLESINLISLDEGNTPLEEVKDTDNNTIYIKREDLNPTGSWKDRGTAYKLSKLINDGINEIVLASSGNAAVSFLKYANVLQTQEDIPNFKLHIVISPGADKKKQELIDMLASAGDHRIYIDPKAKTKAAEISAQLKIPNLKSALDSDLTKGYWSLGIELSKLVKHNQDKELYLAAPVSSGTALVGIIEGLQSALQNEYLLPKVIVCQTQSTNPIVDLYHNKQRLEENDNSESSLASAIVDKSAMRAPQIINLIKQTKGDALNIKNEELLAAENFIKEKNSFLSYTSLLGIAAYLRLKQEKGNSFKNTYFISIASGR